MNMFVRLLLINALMVIFLANMNVNGTDTASYQLQWKPHFLFPVNEDEYIDVLYFENARYSDTLPQLPLFSLQFPLDVPHFSYQFTINNTEYVAVSQHEDAVLREISFSQQEIQTVQAMQSSRKQRYTVMSFYPFVYDSENDQYKKLHTFSLTKELLFDPHITYGQTRQ